MYFGMNYFFEFYKSIGKTILPSARLEGSTTTQTHKHFCSQNNFTPNQMNVYKEPHSHSHQACYQMRSEIPLPQFLSLFIICFVLLQSTQLYVCVCGGRRMVCLCMFLCLGMWWSNTVSDGTSEDTFSFETVSQGPRTCHEGQAG